MDLLYLFAVFGLVTSAVVAWFDDNVEELKKELADVKNETAYLKSRNRGKLEYIIGQREVFKAEISRMNAQYSKQDKELNDTMIKLAEVRSELVPVYASDRLLQRIGSYDNLILSANKLSQQWIHWVEKVGINDTHSCFYIRDYLIEEGNQLQTDYNVVDDDKEEEEEGSINTRARWRTAKQEAEIDDKMYESGILTLELDQAKAELKTAQLERVELRNQEELEHHYHQRMFKAQHIINKEIAGNLEKAKMYLNSFKDSLRVKSKEVSKLMKQHQDLVKRMEVDANDPKVPRAHAATKCFSQLMDIAASGYFNPIITLKPLLK